MRGGGHGTWWGSESEGTHPHIERRLLWRAARYALPYRRLIAVMLFTMLVISLLELAPPLLFRSIIDDVLPNRDLRRLNFLALGLLAVPLISGLVSVAQRYFSASVGEGIIFDLRQQMYEHMQRMSIRFFTDTKGGEILSRFNNDVVGAQNAVANTLVSVVSNVVILATTLAIMLSIEARLALLSVAVVPLFLLPTRWGGRIVRRLRRRSSEFNARMTSLLTETLSIGGVILTKAFGRQGYESERFRESNRGVRDMGIRQALVGRWLFMSLGLAGAVGVALVYWEGGRMVLSGGLTVGTIVAFAAYLMRLYQPVTSLSNVQVEVISALVSFERVFQYLDLSVEIQDAPGAVDIGRARGDVRFEKVSFSYRLRPGYTPQEEKMEKLWALRHVSFEIQPGQMVGLVGPSGAGKTTVSYLLHRFYDPTEGRITLDGVDLRQMSQACLARQMGIVTQEPHLFHDTIRNNLLYARPEAAQGELEAACRTAEIHSLIQSLPQGYDTVVGERGYRLSGGEKQRLAIARAILKDPPLLLLDEATSHLDSESESLIQQALKELLRGRTSLVIAHRLSTVLAADLIVVLDQGEVVEQGTHHQLLAQGGLYFRLYG